MKSLGFTLSLVLACCGCAATPQPVGHPEPEALCKADALSVFIGQTASATAATEILAASVARTLRWAPPRSAVTMDYRADRVTVSYDDDMVITRASCG